MADTPLAPFDGTTRTRWIPEIGDAMRANYQRLLSELDLIARARSEGLENRPATGDKDLDAPQREALAAVEEGASMLRQFAESCVARARALIQERTPKALDSETAIANLELELDRLELERSQDLVVLAKDATRTQRQLNKFRRDHALERDAFHLDSWMGPATVVLACLTVESVVNAGTFSSAGGGILGGLLAAVVASCVNFGAGFFTGAAGLRYLNHKQPRERGWGGVATIGGIGFGLFVNLVIAQYREALLHNVDGDVTAAATQAFTLAHIGSASLWSWLLFAFGLLIFLVAVHEGRGGENKMLEPYPGYRQLAEPHRRARGAHDAAMADFAEAISTKVDAALGAARDRIQREAREVADARDIASQAAQRSHEIDDSLEEWRDMGHTLLSTYRGENEAIRTAPVPSYFAVFPDLRAIKKGVDAGGDLAGLAETAASVHASNAKACGAVEREAAKLLKARLQEFRAMIARIDARAKAELAAEDAVGSAPATPPSQRAVEYEHEQ